MAHIKAYYDYRCVICSKILQYILTDESTNPHIKDKATCYDRAYGQFELKPHVLDECSKCKKLTVHDFISLTTKR